MGVQQQAAQRYYNKGTGRMEGLVHGKFPGAPSHVPGAPGRHNVSKTVSTTTTKTPVFNPATVADWTKLSGPQLRTFAEYLVGQDTKGAQVPFQQANQRLGGEQQRSQQAVGQAGQGVLSSIQGTQAKAATAAQGFASQGAQIASQGKQAVEQAYKSAEGGYMSPELQAQKTADLNRQAAQSQTAQTGANARQQEMSNWLASAAQTAPLRTQQQEGQIGSQYGKLKAGNTEKEAALIAQQPAKTQELFMKLFGQQTALNEARQKLGVQVQKNEITYQGNREKGAIGRANAESRAQQVRQTGSYQRSQVAYKNATLAEKTRQDAVKNKQGAERIKQAGEKNAQKTGLKLSPAQLGKVTEGLSGAFTTIERLRIENEDYGTIRQKLATGQEPGRGIPHYSKGKVVGESEGKRIKVPKVTDGVVVRAAEEAWKYHAVSPQTLQQLASKGLSFTSQREAYEVIAGRPYTPPQRSASGVTGSARAGR